MAAIPGSTGVSGSDRTMIYHLFLLGFFAIFSTTIAKNPVLPLFTQALGADDTVIKPSWGQQPVDALKAAGGNVKFTILPDHDHDVWTDTYADQVFYDWLLANQK
jgi:hypothetical protein